MDKIKKRFQAIRPSLHHGQVLYYHPGHVLYYHCILVRFYYCIIIRTLSASWSSIITASLSGHYLHPGQFDIAAVLSSPVLVSPTWSSHILPLHFGQVLTTSSFQVLYYHCILVKSFHIIHFKSNITAASWSSHST